MGVYVRLFETESAYTESRNSDYIEPWTSYVESLKRVDYNKTEDEKLLSMPFTVEVLSNGNIIWKGVKYSKNGGEWITISSNTSTSIPVEEGDEVAFKANNTSYDTNGFSSSARFNVKGNIMSLTDGDDFMNANTINESAFRKLFYSCANLVSASKLKLPVTVLSQQCYSSMFYGCSSLIAAPELPATTLAIHCYSVMFQGCTSLEVPPELPATTLQENCYNSMFSGCVGLVTARELPATVLAPYCYYQMFSNCSSLTIVPEELPATQLESECYYRMFEECSSLTTAPVLPALTVGYESYKYMFYKCSSLNYIKAMFTSTPGNSYTGNWVQGVSSSGTFVKNSAAEWSVTGINGIPSNWTVETASS